MGGNTQAENAPPTCRSCGRQPGPREQLVGPQHWYTLEPVCRHAVFYICPECWEQKRPGAAYCPVCGCQEFYCG